MWLQHCLQGACKGLFVWKLQQIMALRLLLLHIAEVGIQSFAQHLQLFSGLSWTGFLLLV